MKFKKTLLTGALALSMITPCMADTYAANCKITNSNSIITSSSEAKRSVNYNIYKRLIKISLNSPLMKRVLSVTEDDSDRLSTQLADLLFNIAWQNPSTIPTALKKLNTAIQNTTGGLKNLLTSLTLDDIQEYSKQITSIYRSELTGNESVTYSTIQDLALFSSLSSTNSHLTEGYPIGIGKVTVQGGAYGNGTEATMVILTGTSFVEGQSSGVLTDLLCGCETDNIYLDSAVHAVLENVEKGSNLIIEGYSLGGMMAQQLMVQPAIYENYNIIEVTSLGAPALMVDERNEDFQKAVSKSSIHRVINYYDLVPYLCLDYFTDASYLNNQIPEKDSVYETLQVEYENNYKTGFMGVHALGYIQDAVWKNYDIFGYDTRIEDGHSISLNFADFTYYSSPAFLSGTISTIE